MSCLRQFFWEASISLRKKFINRFETSLTFTASLEPNVNCINRAANVTLIWIQDLSYKRTLSSGRGLHARLRVKGIIFHSLLFRHCS